MSTITTDRPVDPRALCVELAASVRVAVRDDGLTAVTADVTVERLQAVVDQHQPVPLPNTVTVEVDPAQLEALHDRLDTVSTTTAAVLRDLITTLVP